MGRLSDEEKQETRECALSKVVREEFQRARKRSARSRSRNLDDFIQFLTAMSRLNPKPIQPRAFVEYKQVKL